MKLQNKSTMTILLIVIAFILIISIEQIFMILPKFETINIQKAYNNINEGIRVLNDERTNMAIIVSDYAVWDDTYLYTQNKDEKYIETNFTEDTLANLNMSFVGVYGKNGFLFSLNTFADDQQTQMLQDEILKSEPLKSQNANGFLTVKDKTYMVATKKISTTDESMTSDYYFTFVRDYLDFTNRKLEEIPGASLKILDFMEMTEEQKQYLLNLSSTNETSTVKAESPLETFYKIPDYGPMQAYSYLKDIDEKPFAVLQSETDTNIIAEGRSSMHQTGVILVLFGITIALVSAFFVRRNIISPLNHLKDGLNRILETESAPKNDNVNFLIDRSDEIGELYKNFISVSHDIKVANEENKRINNHLETLVEERTKALKAANNELILYGETFEETSESLVITDPNGKIIMCNKSYELLSGYSKKELYGKNPRIIKSGSQEREDYEELWAELRKVGKWQGEVGNLKKNGQIVPVWLNIDTIRNEADVVTHYVGAMSDMTIKKDMQIQLEKMAFYDTLTGLPNRALFYLHLQKAITRAVHYDFLIAILFIDLDGFKLVNDTFGHRNGDLLLIEVGKRISTHIRESDLVSRWGGDEFTIVLENINEKTDVIKIVNDLLYNISQDITVSGERISIGASVGIAIYPDDGETVEQIMIKADTAMYTSKTSGKNCYTFASNDDKNYEIPKIIMMNRLKKAVDNSEFYLVYQPQIQTSFNKSRIYGAEALIRWADEDGNTHMPDEFIHLAEETGMINVIGEWVIDEACRMIRELNDLEVYLPISVNVSIVQFKTNDLITKVKNAIEKNQIDPQYLYLEITENTFADDELQILSYIRELKTLGIKIVLDDFGKGYSSLGLITQLPFDILKVDKTFTQNNGLEKEKKLAKMIISIGDILDIQSIIEGVETLDQVDFHLKHGGSIYQGYFFSRPIDKNDFIDLCLGKWELENLKCLHDKIKKEINHNGKNHRTI